QDHSQAAAWHNRSFERCFSLKANDYLLIAIDVTGRVGKDATRDLGDIENSFATLFKKQRVQSIPYVLGAFGCASEKRTVPFERFIILLYEVAYINIVLPQAPSEIFPGRS